MLALLGWQLPWRWPPILAVVIVVVSEEEPATLLPVVAVEASENVQVVGGPATAPAVMYRASGLPPPCNDGAGHGVAGPYVRRNRSQHGPLRLHLGEMLVILRQWVGYRPVAIDTAHQAAERILAGARKGPGAHGIDHLFPVVSGELGA